ncbi:unnamed protein product [Vicia faba]|uniref:EF-hand domain-containing protein n=1 Tax=Vicia faba TaxID=3906 RepID=A0AAV0Z7W4_VICFA|nr:unnamed protein product [Vicia faba]
MAMDDSHSSLFNLGILDTLTQDELHEILDSYDAFCNATQSLLGGAGDLSYGAQFVSHVHTLCKHGLESLVRDHFLRVLEETFERNGASRFWRHFVPYADFVDLDKHGDINIDEDEIESVLYNALEEISLEKQYQEKCLLINYIQVIYAKMEIELSYNDLVEKTRARHSDIESSSSSKTTGGLGMYWWRGGRLSRKLFNCKVLPRSFVTKAARQAGFRKIPGILYPENSDFAKRSRCVSWRAVVEMSTSVDQLALQATALYKLVAERGPWSSLSRWALEAYLKGDVGKAYMLYSRMAEMGYEVAQSNAAWILDKYGERSMCMGESGLCTDAERHQRAHSLWWQASEQGNEHAALLIGDAYYYGMGTVRDYDRAAEAYMHAKSQSNAQAMFNLGYMHEHGQ